MGKMRIFNDMQLALKLKNDEITESTMWKYFIASIAFSPIFDFFTGILLCFLSRHITLQDYVIGGNFAQLMINPISIAIHIFAIYLIRNTNLGFAKSVQYYACLSLPAAIRMALIYICLLLFTDLMDSSIRDSNGEINEVVYSVWMFCFEVFPVFYFYRRILICFRLISA
ncbi:hypothetical protein [Candidatus Lariskella endosymbiont of Epinotia ramella]|uniref:hypothetical protein n=1 Tax=Candidatus Lariskella endosymbiont of Epinotia ramella TaxID=3066224 RepID=UPI0030CE6B0D